MVIYVVRGPEVGPCPENEYSSHLGTGIHPNLCVV